MIAAGDQQHMANAAAPEVIDHRGEVAEGVAGAVIQTELAAVETLLTLLGLGMGLFVALYGTYRMLLPAMGKGKDKED